MKTSENIPRLLRLMIFIAIFSAIAIVSMTGLGMNRIYSSQVIKMAEEESALIARLLVEDNFDTLISRNEAGRLHLRIDPLEIEWLNQSFREFLESLNIVKLKIFTPDTRVAYSTENQLIGKFNLQNVRLERALGGKVDSHIEVKGQIQDLKGELTLDIDVVETYIPITLQTGEIVGAFELYMDVTKFREEIQFGTLKLLILLSSAFLIVYLAASRAVWVGMKRAARAEDQLRKQAMIDALTGVLNRGELMNRVEKEISRIERFNPSRPIASLGLAILDIDHFKKVNDTFGHQIGDAVLQEVAVRIKNQLRPYDIFGRYGGEEFLALFTETTPEDTKRIAERIRACISATPFMIDSNQLNISVSLGVSFISSGDKLTEAIDLVDKALYAAKHNGRNRVEVFEKNHLEK